MPGSRLLTLRRSVPQSDADDLSTGSRPRAVHHTRKRKSSVPTYTAPGVYIEEIPSSQKVLSSAPTAVAAFVGSYSSMPAINSTDGSWQQTGRSWQSAAHLVITR